MPIWSYNECILAEELNFFLNTLLITVHETAITARYVNYYRHLSFPGYWTAVVTYCMLLRRSGSCSDDVLYSETSGWNLPAGLEVMLRLDTGELEGPVWPRDQYFSHLTACQTHARDSQPLWLHAWALFSFSANIENTNKHAYSLYLYIQYSHQHT